MPKLKSLNIGTLKELLRSHELATQGTKNEMVARLVEHLQSDEIDQESLEKMVPPNTHLQTQIDELKDLVSQLANIVATNVRQPRETNIGQQTCDTVENVPMVTNPIRTWSSHSVQEIAATIPEFDPTNDMSLSVEQFIERVNASNEAYGWNPKSLLLAINGKLKGVAKMWFESTEHFSSTWNELQTALVVEFSQQLDETEIHRKMSAAGRKPNEQVDEYCFRIAALGRRFKLSEPSIIKHTRNGLNYRELQAATAAMRFQSLKDMRETFVQFIKNQPTYRQTVQPQTVGKSNREERTEAGSQKSEKCEGTKSKRSNAMKCFNCHELGHISLDCQKPQRRRRCTDCQKVHPLGEPADCGKKAAVSRRIKTGDDIFTKTIYIDDIQLSAFVDTGSQCNMIRSTVSRRLPQAKERCALTIKGIGGGVQRATERMVAMVKADTIKLLVEFYVVPDTVIDTDVLLGQDIFTQDENIKMTVENLNLTFRTARAEITNSIASTVQRGEMSQAHSRRLEKLLQDHRDCFSFSLHDIGETALVSLKIEVDTDKPIAQNPYRVPQPKRVAVIKMVNELLEAGIIQPSESEYASPITLVKKRDGNDRFCIDYRRLNQHIRKEVFPTPNIEERLQDAKQYKLFSTLDLNSGYYQIPVEENSRKYTAFVTTEGLYEFKRMPFGLKNAPMAFQRLMVKLKNLLQPDDMIHYMDDILIGANGVEEMFEKIDRVLKALLHSGLTLNPKKCSFFQSTISFLGHTLTATGIEPGVVKTASIANFKAPENVTEVRRFLGLSGYFRKFVPGYAITSEPIRQLLRKGVPFQWGKPQQNAFEMLKTALTKKPVLAAFNVDSNHQLHTDASAVGIAAVLLQETFEGWKPVAYYSRSTSAGEAKMHSYELETLAVVDGLERFRYYIYGKPITVITDCSAVTATWSKRELIPRIARWWLRVQDFQITMEHRNETRMSHVDALSRMPEENAHELEEATLRVDRADIAESDWLFSMQLQDDVIQEKIKKLDIGEKQTEKDYVLENGRLFKRLNGRKLWVVPKNIRYKVTQDIHERGGHLSVDRTIEKLQQLMWFPRMRNVVKSFLKSCVECAYNKSCGGKTEGEYHFSEMDEVPFKVVHVDHLGPFPRSSRRNEHILVIVDAFTKYVFMRAVPNTSTRQVLKVFDEVTSFMGMPEKIISDRGTAFTSKDFQLYCRENVIKHVLTAVRTPRANGQVERVNRTILSMLLPMTKDNKRWDDQLRNLQWTLNSTINATTRRSPHDLLFGYQPRDILGNKLVLALHDTVTRNCTQAERRDTIEQQRKAANQHIAANREKAKQRFDKQHSKPTTYSIGDLVLVKNGAPSIQTSKKLEPKFKGPFVVTSKLGNDRYVVEDLPGAQRKQRHYNSVHASDSMKHWCNLPPDELLPDDCLFDEDIDE